jgi:uncharacterized protein
VVLLPDLGGEDVDAVAVQLFESWGLGGRESDRGLLLLVSLSDRRARLEVGYGLEGLLPDGRAGELLRTELVPSFKEGRYEEGVLRAARAAAAVVAADRGITLEGAPARAPPAPARGRELALLLLVVLLLLPVLARDPWAFLYMLSAGGGRRRDGWGGSGGGFGRGSGGFGGFGGGRSGGGGASVGW